ncbi:MAG: Cytidylate kinase [Gemmatimonadetes bacterium]|jgi:cytidylate kinase|nr:Cytidylate kinase [Gemmatimonadota bacterium]
MPDRKPVVIAIDGPAASGKSSTSQWVAERLGWLHVDSGSLYRALTAAMVRTGRPPETWSGAEIVAQGPRISLRAEKTSFSTLIDGEPADDEIRGGAVTAQVSRVAQVPEVRAWVNARVRQAAESHDVVVDGRDMGTAVFPDAPLKVFLVADSWERARRRLTQRLERGPTDDEIAEETDLIVQRDAKDATQTLQAKDAVLLDTTYLTQAEQVERIVALAHAVSHRPDAT